MACQVARAEARDLFSRPADGGFCQSTAAADEHLPFPTEFIQFLLRQNVDPRVYCAPPLPRYIRLKPCGEENAEEQAKVELGAELQPVSWLPGFFKCSAETLISNASLYKSGQLYGMDVASGASVAALEIKPGDHVLDLCAAPGAKLCMIAELLGVDGGSLTGVDISRPRLAACRTMLQKYGLGTRSRLFLADGTSFSILPVRSFTPTTGINSLDKNHVSSYLLKAGSTTLTEWRPRKSRKEKQREQRAAKEKSNEPELFFYGNDSGVVGMDLPAVLSNETPEAAIDRGYDKVLVDAECTHDGSLKHLCKFEQWGWETFETRFFNQERISAITTLQLALLVNGFKLLKRGGTLVYSTCSFTYDQNEGVVKTFLELQSDAELHEIEAAKSWPCKPGGVKYCLRFDPLTSRTNGQFIAKFLKTK